MPMPSLSTCIGTGIIAVFGPPAAALCLYIAARLISLACYKSRIDAYNQK